jgi:uncharacterized protein (TIGR00251 family)
VSRAPKSTPSRAWSLKVQITPNAPRSEVVGWLGDRLKIKIKAPAVEGKANAELRRFLAESLEICPGDVTILQGETGRVKVLQIDGGSENALLLLVDRSAR